MKQHFTEADLLETYYTKPGESLPVMMHLAECAECAARYERLEKKMQSLRECPHHDEKPETFWVRQRMSILRKIDARRQRRGAVARLAAAAAIVVAVTTGVLWDRTAEEPAVVAAPVVVEESPWQSDELNEYSSMVAWESWVEDGDQS